MAIPKLPGLPTAPASLQGWISGAQDVLRALREFVEKTDFFNARRIMGMGVQQTKPEDGQVLTVADGASKAVWADAAAGYTDEQAQDAVGGIVLPASGPVTLIYNDATPSITVAVADAVGDSGSGGTRGLVPAPAAGDAAAGKFLKADLTWAVPSGGGGTAVELWMPEMVPASSHATSDFFRGSDPGWAEWDVEGSFTWSRDTTRHFGLMSHTGDGATRWAGVYQANPDTEFAFICEIAMFGIAVSYVNIGLLLAADIAGSPSTAAFRTGYAQVAKDSSTPTLGTTVATWTNHTGSPSQVTGSSIAPRFLRMRVNGTTVAFDVSPDGFGWIRIDEVTVAFTPAYFGLAGQVTSVNSFEGMIRQFKVVSGAGTSAFGYDNRQPIGAAVNIVRI